MSYPSLYLAFPAFNEEKSIAPLFTKIVQLQAVIVPMQLKILFYDDGSTDQTKIKVQQWRKQLNITYLESPLNVGLGFGMNQLVSHFVRHATQGDYLAMMDCDDTHDPMQLLQMLQRLQAEPMLDIVIASRFCDGAWVKGLSRYRHLMSAMAGRLLRWFHPIKNVREYTCMYRVFKFNILQKTLLHYTESCLKESGFACAVELILKTNSVGAQMVEVPLQLRYYNKLSASKMRVFRYATRLFYLILKWRLVGFV